jgi:hypothetical protein
MKRSSEARCHAGIQGKKCQLAPVKYRECALRQTYVFQAINPRVEGLFKTAHFSGALRDRNRFSVTHYRMRVRGRVALRHKMPNETLLLD